MPAKVKGVIAEVPAVILRCISRDEAALAVAQKAFKGLYENASNNAHVDAHLVILVAISDVSKLVVKELTSWLAARPGSPESLQQLIEIAKNPANAAALSSFAVGKEDIMKTSRDKKVSLLFADWYNICETSYHFSLDYGEELSVSNCVSSEEMKPQSHQGQQISFLAIEDQGSSKLSLLPKILVVTVYSKRCWRKREHPLIPGKDLCSLDPVFDGANFQVHFLYKGALRVLLVLVLLHDFPELLCDYHFSFCDVIPPSCIRMQNIILSALPRNMRLPDPSTPNLKTRQQGSLFLTELKHKLLLSSTDAARAGTRYNVPLINSLVLYVRMQISITLKQGTGKGMGEYPNLEAVRVTVFLSVEKYIVRLDIKLQDLDVSASVQILNPSSNSNCNLIIPLPTQATHIFSTIDVLFKGTIRQEIIYKGTLGSFRTISI
ncbi:hypothetical protein ACS0TY_001780 [Phlomoides rotata]